MIGKTITNKLAVSSTTHALLKTQIFVDVFLIEEFENVALRKELLNANFIECFKTEFGKALLIILSVFQPVCLSTAFLLTDFYRLS